MTSSFLIYGANGYTGQGIARLAVEQGLRPIVAGRNASRVHALASELEVEHRVFGLEDATAMRRALADVTAVLHCAGPYIHTHRTMIEGCLDTQTHYLDLTGEIPVLESLAGYDARARASGVMVMPGVGLAVVATDCLALHLKNRLPSATHLAMALFPEGPAGAPPGTIKSMLEMVPLRQDPASRMVRRDGQLVFARKDGTRRMVDFGNGPIKTTRTTWGDVFTAFHTTGIRNIDVYFALPDDVLRQFSTINALRPLLKFRPVRRLLARLAKTGSTVEERARSRTSIWAEVWDDEGHSASARLHGPEGGLVWTGAAAVAVLEEVLAGKAPPGFNTPALAYGPDLVMRCAGVSREDEPSSRPQGFR